MNTETKPDYKIARDELSALFASLNLKVSISEPFGMMQDDWACIRYTVTIQGEAFTYSLGLGHVKWVQPEKLSRSFFWANNGHFSGFTWENILRTKAQGKTISKTYRAEELELAAALAKFQKKQPNPAEVLACVCREGVDSDESFDNWCANFGSDSDSIKAFNTYNECTENGKKARHILSAANFQKMAELSAQL